MIVKTRKLSYPVDQYACHTLLAQLYSRRGIPPDAIDHSLKHLPSPFEMRGMDRMVARLIDAIEHNRKICVAADYDADGATACAVAVEGLRRFGANVAFMVPDRATMGYGLTPALVDVIAGHCQPDLILTVDNGIASHAGIAHAARLGIDVLVTDHHLPGDRLPPASAIVNPNLPDDPFPGRPAGVGVMFYVLIALRAELGRSDIPLSDLLDLVAVGTIADMVPMDCQVNRILAAAGLARMRAGKVRPGIRALAEVAGCNLRHLGATDIGFAIAPRLNAAGRLDDMTYGIRLLLSADPAEARRLAQTLDELNRSRRAMEQDIRRQAEEKITAHLSAVKKKILGICVFDKEWHEGVIGIVASRIKESFRRPVIVFTRDRDGHLKGSGRSVPGVHLRDLLAAIDIEQPGLLLKYGGHAMAAGLTIDGNRLAEFAEAFDRHAAKYLSWDQVIGEQIETDGELPLAYFNLQTAEMLRQAAPWGQELPPPTFYGNFTIVDARRMGDEGQHLRLRLLPQGGREPIEAVSFFEKVPDLWVAGKRIRAVYQPEVNEYRQERRLQLILQHLADAPAIQKKNQTGAKPPSRHQIKSRVFKELGLE